MSLAVVNSAIRVPQGNTVCQPSRRLAEIDRAREAAKIGVRELLLESGVTFATWYDAKAGKSVPREDTFRKLELAIDRLKTSGPRLRPPAAIRALVLAAEEILRARIAGELLYACNPMRASRSRIVVALPSARLRVLAIYLVAVELEIENVAIASAIGCSRENVRKARETVEKLRDHVEVECLFDVCGKLLSGRP